MAIIDVNKNIEAVRGNKLPLTIRAKVKDDGSLRLFEPNDIVRFKVMVKSKMDQVMLQKDVEVTELCESVSMLITSEEMKFGSLINKPTEYWYEVELNPDTPDTITILGYTNKKDGAKILTLLPEGGDKK